MAILSKEALPNHETLREFQRFRSSRVSFRIGVKLHWKRSDREVVILIPRYVIYFFAQMKEKFFWQMLTMSEVRDMLRAFDFE